MGTRLQSHAHIYESANVHNSYQLPHTRKHTHASTHTHTKCRGNQKGVRKPQNNHGCTSPHPKDPITSKLVNISRQVTHFHLRSYQLWVTFAQISPTPPNFRQFSSTFPRNVEGRNLMWGNRKTDESFYTYGKFQTPPGNKLSYIF